MPPDGRSFVRFVAGDVRKSAYLLEGIFQGLTDVEESGALDAWESDLLRETRAWFSEHLPSPWRKPTDLDIACWMPSGTLARVPSANAVCWFRPEATEHLQRAWVLVSLLREHGVQVRMVSTTRPGDILYQDEFQVVAERPPRDQRDPRLGRRP